MRVNAPKGVLNDALRAQITEHKAELLTFFRNAGVPIANLPPPISRRATNGLAPLSFAQERLWFLEQLEPSSAVYNICRASRLIGKLNIAALEASLKEIVRRHKVLRSSIRAVDGRAVQVAPKEFEFKLSAEDLKNFSADERNHAVQRRITEESERPFDFAAGQFLRAVLLRTAADEHVLILMTHHIVSDAWSMGILTRELWTLYEALAIDNVSPLDDLPLQYSDFALWQREWLQGEVLESHRSYWKKQLADISILNLPTDRPRPARQSYRGARVPITLPESLTAAANDLTYRFNVTPFMTLLAAFQVLLHRYSGQDDIVVGSPVANRRRPEIEGLIGFFVNALVLRADLSGNPSFKQLLSRVRDVCLAADANQDLPFEKLVQYLQPERDQSRNPLFQIMFVLQNATSPFTKFPGLRVEPIEIENTRSPFDLSVFLREREGKYIGYIEYGTDLFNRERIERMAGHFQTLLEGIIADPDQPISTLPILTDSERHRILVEWNDTAADYPRDKCIQQLFEAQVERTPDAVAVEFDRQELTYRELNRRANQLAHYLINLGVGPEKLVGICVERSLEMVVGLLGILKAGGAYVPLDPTYPRERLEFMLNDAQCPVLLTQEGLVEDRGVRMDDGDPRSSILDPRIKAVCLDRDWSVIAQESEENPESGVDSKNLAYVIYTSGSTGTPKGVAIEHRNTMNLLHWATSVFTATDLAGVLASTSVCFDLSVFELFVPLSCGGKAILVGNALCLHELGEKRDATLINTVPSVMSQVLALGPLPESVCVVNLAGEPLGSELVDRIYEQSGVEKVYDLYGPSETTTYSTFTLRTRDGPTTIGRPIPNTQVYILDSHLQPVPIGVQGELYIGGAGVARGYVNRPELTAEKFISDTFGNDVTSRVYRTGDHARYLPDGNIDFLGRLDNQVKIRGYRIELGEIEATLNFHPAVKESIVLANKRQGASGRELVGYVVLDKASAPDLNDVRSFLATKLPTFMIPPVIVSMDILPLTPNGKIDRAKLPPPGEARSGLDGAPIPPRSALEELVANVWRDVLQTENVSVHDSFFALGGHSLLAIQVVSRLQEAFNKEVPLRLLFDAPTIAEFGQELEIIIRDGNAPKLPPIVRAPRDGPLPLSMNQAHLWTLVQKIPSTHLFNMPYVYRLSGDLNVAALESALEEIVRRHEALRTVFAEVEGRPVQVIKDGFTLQLPIEDLRGATLHDVSQRAAVLLLEERGQIFDLATGPLFKIKLLRLSNSESFLLVTMHHIISDHWSMQVFRRELVGIYQAYSQGRGSPFRDLPFQFGDHAVWEKRLLENGVLAKQQEYWQEQLSEPLSEVEFTKGPAGNKELSFRTSRQPIEFDENLLRGIKAVARRENCTPFMVILAALNLVVYAFTGQEDVRIGTLVANRRRREIESAIGHFLNTVVLRARVTPNLSSKQLLRQVRDITLAAHAHQELPCEQLTRVLEREKRIKRGALFQVLLSYQTADSQPVNPSGLTFAPLGWQLPMSDSEVVLTACDLIMNIKETSTRLIGSVNYKTDTFDNCIVVSMVERFIAILKQMVVDTEQFYRSAVARR